MKCFVKQVYKLVDWIAVGSLLSPSLLRKRRLIDTKMDLPHLFIYIFLLGFLPLDLLLFVDPSPIFPISRPYFLCCLVSAFSWRTNRQGTILSVCCLSFSLRYQRLYTDKKELLEQTE